MNHRQLKLGRMYDFDDYQELEASQFSERAYFGNRRYDWQTPPEIFNPLHEEFEFTLDAAATAENTMLPRFWTEEENGLKQSWEGERLWINPPYGKIGIQFIMKAHTREAELSVLLLPVRSDTKVWHECILHGEADEIRFLRGRVQFVGAKYRSPFPSCIVIYKNTGERKHGRESLCLFS